jgi:hypothetical protein
MSTDPEETNQPDPEKQDKIERVPEGTFAGTRERLSDDEPEPDDTGDQGHGQN